MDLPSSHRFDKGKTEAQFRRAFKVVLLSWAFGALYPIFGGIFYSQTIVIQALMVPVFFALRTFYDSSIDGLLKSQYGSDGVSSLSMGGVAMHEVCLSVMLTNIKHPLVFASLVFCDVMENAVCMVSLWKALRKTNSVVTPDVDESIVDAVAVQPKKRFVKRSSSVYSLINDLSKLKNQDEKMGTVLYIRYVGARKVRERLSSLSLSLSLSLSHTHTHSTPLSTTNYTHTHTQLSATLLLRETMETVIPFQAMIVLTVLYSLNVPTNSLVTDWSENDYRQAIRYTFLDLVVELIIFTCTVLALRSISTKIKPLRIIIGEIHMHAQLMFWLNALSWLGVLLFQCTHSGVDLSFQFQWISKCASNNETKVWLQGYDWGCK